MRTLSGTFLALIIASTLQGQGLDELRGAIDDPQRKVQAIHHYPENVKDGECHFVEVVSINVTGGDIVIIESWSNWLGQDVKTTLTGKIRDNIATGVWESSYSNGHWTYNFRENTGRWNKVRSVFDRFEDWQPLELRCEVTVKNGFYTCR